MAFVGAADIALMAGGEMKAGLRSLSAEPWLPDYRGSSQSKFLSVPAPPCNQQQQPQGSAKNHCCNDFFREDPGRALWIQGEARGSRE
jgi:hypothetical protein